MAHDLQSLGLGISLPFLDELSEQYSRDPRSVDASWLPLLDAHAVSVTRNGLAERNGDGAQGDHNGQNGQAEHNGQNGRGTNGTAQGYLAAVAPVAEIAPRPAVDPSLPADRVYRLFNAYRARGHLEAHLDPLDHLERQSHPDLDPRSYGFSDADLDKIVLNVGLYGAPPELPLREILRRLRATYCRTIGIEMMHISAPERRQWLQERIEPALNEPTIDRETRLHILDLVAAADVFERFCATKYVNAKRFGLDGSEALIPLIDMVLERAGMHGVEEAVIGMSHRGRLNVLANIMHKSAGDIFTEFQDVDPMSALGGGDVKYHLGFSSEHVTRGGRNIHLSLAFNPSHLEAVDPVVLGRVRAKQRRRHDSEKQRVLGILMHGDAAFAGQGLVPECLNLSELRGYRTGGTIHVIVNNQIGFTTSPAEGRSTPYCTDVAKMIQCPMFHVNGDDPEAVAHVVRLAMDYRRAFASDVVIDMFCFRRYGHNETDEPSFTQPLLYQKIERHPPLAKIYSDKLVSAGLLSHEDYEGIVARRKAIYDTELTRAQAATARPRVEAMGGVWSRFAGGSDDKIPDVETGVPRATLAEIAQRITTVPETFHPHAKITRLLAERAAMGRGEALLNWGMAEALAYGSLLWEGTLVRLSGQDCRRGTFSHRHAVLVDVQTGDEYHPLGHLRENQGVFSIFDSPLSEAAVLGFEYGYSLDYPDGLVMWEAQFGDFVNGAQVILDQFLSSSEDKWNRLSGLTMLLPHGYEGQGPEHSSARFERFLQLCAEDNIQVCYPSTPAQFFHLLRRQVTRRFRKPLIVCTPKSLLRKTGREPEPLSSLDELTTGRFQRILDDVTVKDATQVTRLLLCTGKVYYDLAHERNTRNIGTTAIIRLEQLYPLRESELAAVMARYPAAQQIRWVQEEAANMGAWSFIAPILARNSGSRPVMRISRVESASPATGSNKAHQIEQQLIVDAALD